MKFKRITRVMGYPDYVREDGKITITTTCVRTGRKSRVYGCDVIKDVFCVYNENGDLLETCSRLKEAKEKYSE